MVFLPEVVFADGLLVDLVLRLEDFFVPGRGSFTCAGFAGVDFWAFFDAVGRASGFESGVAVFFVVLGMERTSGQSIAYKTPPARI
ncbi:MAG: hypothetical protein HXY34_04395 [Candidatus Thorarchaeota archaeon]|nr:hypothetical protein [Candidatus Thorarchaeota archaeon]